MATELTELVLTYQRLLASNRPKDTSRRIELYTRLCDACRIIFYTYPVKVHVLQEEDAVELMLSMEGRLRHIIEHFIYEHLPFEHYVRKIAYLQAHVLLKRRVREECRYQSVFSTIDEINEDHVSAQDVLYGGNHTTMDPFDDGEAWHEDSLWYAQLRDHLRSSATLRNRMLQLILLSADDLNADQVAFLARFMEMDERTLAHLLTQTHELSEHKRERTRQMITVRNSHFSAKQCFKQELLALREVHADPIVIERTERRLRRAQYHFERSVEELRHRPNAVTHSTIARQVGIPKGTVDSGLHMIRRFIATLMDGCA